MCNRNYVVQYILELGLPWASAEVIARLEGNYAHLAMQKFGSNVIEKCLNVATEENKVCIIKELIGSTVLSQLLQDPYANYVVQSALQVTQVCTFSRDLLLYFYMAKLPEQYP